MEEIMCGSRKYLQCITTPPPHGRLLEILRRRVLKAKLFKEKMKLNWNFQKVTVCVGFREGGGRERELN